MVLAAANKYSPDALTLRDALLTLELRARGLYRFEIQSGTITPREALCTLSVLVLAGVYDAVVTVD